MRARGSSVSSSGLVITDLSTLFITALLVWLITALGGWLQMAYVVDEAQGGEGVAKAATWATFGDSLLSRSSVTAASVRRWHVDRGWVTALTAST